MYINKVVHAPVLLGLQMLYVDVLCSSLCGSSQCGVLLDFHLLMLVEDARGDHMEEAYSRSGFL